MAHYQSKYYKVPAINRLLKIIAELTENPSQDIKGGVLCVLDLAKCLSIKQRVGEMPRMEALQHFEIVNQLTEKSEVVIGRAIHCDGSSAVNSHGQGFLFGNYIVAFVGYADKRLNEAFSLIYNLYLNSFGEKVSAEAFKTIAYNCIVQDCLDNKYIDNILDQFLEWYRRIELAEGERIRILVVDENEEWSERIEDSLRDYEIFKVSTAEDILEAKNKEKSKKPDIYIVSIEQFNGSDWLLELEKNKKVIRLICDNNNGEDHFPKLVKSHYRDQEGLSEELLKYHLVEIICKVLGI